MGDIRTVTDASIFNNPSSTPVAKRSPPDSRWLKGRLFNRQAIKRENNRIR